MKIHKDVERCRLLCNRSTLYLNRFLLGSYQEGKKTTQSLRGTAILARSEKGVTKIIL